MALRLAGSFAHNGGWIDNTAPVVGLGLTPTGTGRKGCQQRRQLDGSCNSGDSVQLKS